MICVFLKVNKCEYNAVCQELATTPTPYSVLNEPIMHSLIKN